MVFVKEDSVRNYGLQKELIFLFFPVAFMMILLVRKYWVKSTVDGHLSELTLYAHETGGSKKLIGKIVF